MDSRCRGCAHSTIVSTSLDFNSSWCKNKVKSRLMVPWKLIHSQQFSNKLVLSFKPLVALKPIKQKPTGSQFAA